MIKLRTIRVSAFLAHSNQRLQKLTHLRPISVAVAVIRCQGDFADVVGCHSPLRALCEISYTCGSMGRPVICECVTDFHYPPPQPQGNTTMTFDQACIAAKRDREAIVRDGR